MTIQRWSSFACLVGLTVGCAACTDQTTPTAKSSEPTVQAAVFSPEQAKAELLAISCEMASAGSGTEEAWKKKNPEKAMRWQELGDIVAKYMETLPANQKEKYNAEVLSGALSCANSKPASATDAETIEKTASDGWQSMHGDSPMDGETYSAVREFHFDDRRTMIAARIFCLVDSQKVGLSLHSFVGSPEMPEPQSAFVAQQVQRSLMYLYQAPGEYELAFAPVGRMRINSGKATSIERNFAVGKTSPNEASFAGFDVLDANALLARNGVAIDEEGGKHFQSGKVNWNALVSQLFPLNLELNNGAGTFNILLDQSPEVEGVFKACGGNNPVYASQG